MTFANAANQLPRTHSQNRLGLSGVRRFPSPLQSSPPNTQDGRTDSWVSPSTNVNIAHPRPTRFHPAQILSQFERMSDNWETRSITSEFLAEIERTEPQNPTQSSHPYSLVAAETPPKVPPIVDHARATERTGPKELENAHRHQREPQAWESPKNCDRQHNSPSVPALRNNANQRISPSSSYSQYSYYHSQAARRRTSPENRAVHTFASQSPLTQSVNPTHDRFPVQEEEEDEPTTASDEDHSYTPYSPTGLLDDPRDTYYNQRSSLNGGNMGSVRARGWDSTSDSLRVLDRNFDQPRTNPQYEQRRPAQSKFGYYDLQHFLEDPASAYIHRYLSSPAPQSPPPSPLSSMFENRDVPPSSPIAPVGSPYPYPFPHIRKRPAHSESPLDPNAIPEQLARQWQIYAQDNGYMTDSTFSPSTTPIQNAYYPWAFPHTSRTLDSGGRLHTDAMSMQSSPSHESVPLPARPVNRRQERERYSARNPRPDAPIPPTRPPTPHSQSLSPSNSGLDPNLIQEQLARQWQIYAQNNMTAPLQNAYNPWAFLHTGRTRLDPDAMDIQSSPSREPVPLPAVLRRRERGKDLVLDIPSLRPDAPTSPPPHSQSPSPSPPPFPHLLGMFENTDMPPSSLIAPVGSPNLQPTDIGDPSFHQTDSVDEDASDAHSQAPPNVSEGLTGGSYFDLPVTEAHEPDHGSRDPDMPFGSLGIHMPLEAASPGESSASPIVSTPSTPSLVIKGPFHYTFSNCSHDHSTRHNNLDFSLDKTIDSGVYLSRISRPSESLLPSLSAIMETRETISCPSKSLSTRSEDLYQALQTAHNILWQLSEQLAKIFDKDNLSALDEFLAELVEISRVQGIRILGAISNLYPAFLGDSEALRRLGHKAIGEAVVEYMAWQDSVTTLLMGVEVEARQLGMAMALRRPSEEQAPVSGDEKGVS
ncbi:hypothetical protein BDN72DRAFT_859846 [Pluteus cervinus]|uniref:Uncharacterized protein n=1 Tax=Pluteus cervinus TaxID=181527 RepID=A0ACD3ALW2_9AGAR|nr:hypothetical protein BDN72DRAFT_859846 [Pluteus cervinus]